MKSKLKIVIIQIFFLLIPIASQADSIPVFGPQRYDRTTGAPNQYTSSFEACNTAATYELIVKNGDAGKNRVSSASLSLNGTEVVKENEFNQKVDEIKKSVSFTLTNNFNVKLQSGPGGFITVSAYCKDKCMEIKISEPQDGSTVNKSRTLVKGILYNAPLEVGINVGTTSPNGGLMPGFKYGSCIAGIVSLKTGANTIAVSVTDSCGYTVADSISVNTNEAQNLISILASPQSGLPSQKKNVLDVNFRAEENISNPVSLYSWDFDGNGTVDQEGQDMSEASFGFGSPGLFFPELSVRDSSGNVYKDLTIVNVISREEIEVILKGKWEKMLNAWKAGNKDLALNYFIEQSRGEFGRKIDKIGNNVSSLFSNVTEIKVYTISNGVANCGILRQEPNGIFSFPLSFVRDMDGMWKIQGF